MIVQYCVYMCVGGGVGYFIIKEGEAKCVCERERERENGEESDEKERNIMSQCDTSYGR